MDYIKYIDTFGIKFHFYTNNQPNHQNVFGGIMTFIYILICILIFIFFCYEDIYRLNPKSTISEISDFEPKTINIQKEKMWIPFRIVTDENKYIDHRGILDIFPHYVEGIYNEKMGMELNYHSLSYKLCNETSMADRPNNYKIDVPLNELFCIDEDDIPFGGNWNGNYIHYIEISLFLCEDGIFFNSTDPRCSKITNFFENFESSISFDFYYPVVQFQPTNLQVPLSIIYKNYFYRLSAYSHKLSKIYFQEHILSDDKNIIKTNYKNTSYWGVRAIYGDDYYLKYEKDPLIKNKLSQVFTMEIYLDYGLVYYTRTYNKIIFILSNVFPLFRLVLYFIKKFTQHIKISLTKRDLAGLIFVNKSIQKSLIQYKNVEKKVSKKKLALKKFPSLKDNSQNELKKNMEIIPDINDKLNRINISQKNISLINNVNIQINNNENISNKKYDNRSNISLTDEIGKNNLNKKKKENPLINLKRKSLVIKESFKFGESFIDNNITFEPKAWRKKFIFPYIYFLLDFFFDKLINPQKFFCVSKKYFTVYNFMCQIYDISTHIILFKQFNILNNILQKIYEDSGNCPARPFKKININDDDVIAKLNKDLKSKKSILFSHNLS